MSSSLLGFEGHCGGLLSTSQVNCCQPASPQGSEQCSHGVLPDRRAGVSGRCSARRLRRHARARSRPSSGGFHSAARVPAHRPAADSASRSANTAGLCRAVPDWSISAGALRRHARAHAAQCAHAHPRSSSCPAGRLSAARRLRRRAARLSASWLSRRLRWHAGRCALPAWPGCRQVLHTCRRHLVMPTCFACMRIARCMPR